MNKIILLILFTLVLNAKEYLYTNIPSDFPSKSVNTSFGKELIKLINNSEQEICFAIYGLRGQDDIFNALLRAKKRGVTIKGVVDTNTWGKNYYSDTYKLRVAFDVKTDLKSYIMHNKFFIFDRKTVWTGSSNISDTGTGGYNANNVVLLDDERIANIYLFEFFQMYDGKFGIHKQEHSYDNIITQDSIISIYFSPKSNTYKNRIKRLIKNAKDYIYIPIFYLTHIDLSNELIKAHKRGVEIKIIIDASAASNKYSTHTLLRKNGITVKVENFGGKMHAKSMIIDDEYFISGSMNFTKAGNSKNDENTLIIRNDLLTKKYKKYFLKIWNMIPDKYLNEYISAESYASGSSCYDNIDNNFDKKTDLEDSNCIQKMN